MLTSGGKCKVCGKWVNIETSEFSMDLPELERKIYCSSACNDHDNWRSKTIRGSWMVIIGYIFTLTAESDILFGLIGIPLLVLGVLFLYQGHNARKLWSLTPEEKNEITEFTDELWDEELDNVPE